MSVLVILTIVVLILEFICLFLVLKNGNTLRQRDKIAIAIHDYLEDLIDNHDRRIFLERSTYMQDCYNSLEPYKKTLFRFWDWGYKNIVPKELYNEIKDYIEE